jgi:hypothetical protein
MLPEKIEVQKYIHKITGRVMTAVEAFDENGVSIGHVLANTSDIDGQEQAGVYEFLVATEGQGLGPQLLRRLTALLGPGVQMHSAIDHEESELILDGDGWFDQAKINLGIKITDNDYLHEIPIVRIYERGGFTVEYINFEESPDQELFAILHAITGESSDVL